METHLGYVWELRLTKYYYYPCTSRIQLEEARAERDSAIENLEVIQEGFEQLKNGSLGEELGNAFQNFQNFAASPGGGEEDMLRVPTMNAGQSKTITTFS